MEWAGARKVSEQKLHLIGKHTTSLQVDVLGVSRRKRDGEELHPCLLRRMSRLVVVAALTGSDDVRPTIRSTAADRGDVVSGQFAVDELVTTIQAKMAVALEQSRVAQRRNIAAVQGVIRALRGENRINLHNTASPRACVNAAAHAIDRRAAGIGDLARVVELDGLLLTNPLQGHAAHIGTQHLLTQRVHIGLQ